MSAAKSGGLPWRKAAPHFAPRFAQFQPGCALFSLDLELADQSRVEIGLALEVHGECAAAFGIGIERLPSELRFDLRGKQGCLEPIDQLRYRVLRSLRRRDQPEPDIGLEIRVAGFGNR